LIKYRQDLRQCLKVLLHHDEASYACRDDPRVVHLDRCGGRLLNEVDRRSVLGEAFIDDVDDWDTNLTSASLELWHESIDQVEAILKENVLGSSLDLAIYAENDCVEVIDGATMALVAVSRTPDERFAALNSACIKRLDEYLTSKLGWQGH
jgi:hypothetical protein